MEYQNHLNGVFPVVPTPLLNDESLDRKGFKHLLNYYIESGSHGLLILGSGGEFPYFTFEEKVDIVKTACNATQKKVPLIVGVGFFSLKESIDFIKTVNSFPIDGLLAILPTYFPIKFEDIVLFYSRLCENSKKPILYYNYPQQTKLFLSPDQILRLLDIKGIVGMKDSILNIGEIKKHIKPDKAIFSGNSFCIHKLQKIGGSGIMGLLPSIVPGMVVDCYDAYKNKNQAKANPLQDRILNLIPLINSFGLSAGIQKRAVQTICSLPFKLKNRNASRSAVVKETLVQMGHPIISIVKTPQPQICEIEKETIKTIISDNQLSM